MILLRWLVGCAKRCCQKEHKKCVLWVVSEVWVWVAWRVCGCVWVAGRVPGCGWEEKRRVNVVRKERVWEGGVR